MKAQGVFDDNKSVVSGSMISDNSKFNQNFRRMDSTISGQTSFPKNMMKKHSSDERPSEYSQGSKVILSAIAKKDAEPILTSNQSVRVFTANQTPKEL